ncbi:MULTISPECIES: PilN domain-containing protein [Pseudomonas]|jgi:type IV pilus assembly protein PilN|uniref:Pilus assembly protein PilN n=1 Tax=Pseudomonas frederiksbergensis TaxID=104087 RepID=A0A0B1YX96_9PSED|nr:MULTISPECIES: PilN domain-containing protein [Pseudomonas]KHK63499.1 pilus assembly protein PilN [Pseudomonas frederiksbergensis]KJH88118.1 pilus assembly protein PilN [Pseudomonas fluorescens]MBI6621208.1 PilN domain-containing protein [Pseudomonas corrugata]MBI6695362.1 PilN domain-containing protein [Pseudomonas corrugata]WRV68892.1 PilN domain-containing protein [Pseudomonas frederiksbergensis]
MARINLLPWREELREERRKRFLLGLAGALVGAVGLILIAVQYLNSAIDYQTARNSHIRQQIAVLDERIQQISELKARRQQLLERMRIIQDLQGNRPVSARIFDQLARTLPDGVYFTDVKMEEGTLSITGAAESNNRVSDLMRNLDSSDLFDAPSLTEVKATTAGQLDQANVFQLTVRQTRPANVEDAQ